MAKYVHYYWYNISNHWMYQRFVSFLCSEYNTVYLRYASEQLFLLLLVYFEVVIADVMLTSNKTYRIITVPAYFETFIHFLIFLCLKCVGKTTHINMNKHDGLLISHCKHTYPASKRRRPNVGLMLGQRRKRHE